VVVEVDFHDPSKDFQSDCWANWQILGQPCESQVAGWGGGERRASQRRCTRPFDKPAVVVRVGGVRLISDSVDEDVEVR
jgi:hypothetical protein